MPLNRWLEPARKNKFCSISDLSNESSVEDFFILPLLRDLGYKNEDIRTKHSIEEIVVSKRGGRKKEPYKPDFVLVTKDAPRVVIDAKATDENIDKYEYQCRGYCLSLNLRFEKEKPTQYFVLSNGYSTKLYKWDEKNPVQVLAFDDFVDGNPQFGKFKTIIDKNALIVNIRKKPVTTKVFEFNSPDIKDIQGIFTACHNLIWKKEKIGPTEAFYKFVKIMFIKLNQDKRLRADGRLKQEILSNRSLSVEDVIFSAYNAITSLYKYVCMIYAWLKHIDLLRYPYEFPPKLFRCKPLVLIG